MRLQTLIILLFPVLALAQTQPRASQIRVTPSTGLSGTNVQSAIDEVNREKAGKNATWIVKNANYTPVATDTLFTDVAFSMRSASAISFTIPSSLTTDFNQGTRFKIKNDSVGPLSILAAPSVAVEAITAGPWVLNEDEYVIATKSNGSDTWELEIFKEVNLSAQTMVSVFTDVNQIGNVTTGEDILFTDTLEANTLSVDGNSIRGRFSGIFANNANAKALRLSFGATDIVTKSLTTPTVLSWSLDYECFRASETTQKCNGTFNGGDGALAYYAATTEDLTEDVIITLTGEAVATNDIIKHTSTMTFNPGAGSGSTPPPIEPPEIPFLITDNAVKGTDGYEHTYVGTWPENSTSPLWYSNTQTNSSTTNDYVELKFNGTEIHWFTEVASHLGIAAVSIDGGAETNVDLYNATTTQQVNVWSSGPITQAEHTVKIRVTGTKNASSSAVYIGHDYLKVDNNEDVAPTPGVDEAQRYISLAGFDTGDCSNIVTPCRTFVYTMTQAVSGDLVQAAAGTYTENGYIFVPLNVDIRAAGIDITVVKGASGLWDDWDDYGWEFGKSLFQFVSGTEQNGEQYIKDLTIDGTGTAYNDGIAPVHSTLLNDRGMYGGIWVDKRNNVTIDGIKVRKCFLVGIFLSNTRFAKVLNSTFIDNGYGQNDFATGNVMWGGVYAEDMELSGNNVNEGFGNGMKAFGPPPVETEVVRLKAHGNYISVVPTGQWNAGSAKNIAFEDWNCPMTDVEIYDNYFDGNVSLIDNEQDDDAVHTVRVYNNVFDMITRSAGESYAIELAVSYAEIDHNYFIGGKDATIANFQTNAYPTLSPWYGFWDFHHNVVIAPQGGNPSFLFYIANRGLHQTNIYNNSIDVDNIAGDNQSSHRNFCIVGSIQTGAASANINIKNNVFWDKSNQTSQPLSNRAFFLNTGNTVSSTSVTHNAFFSMLTNAVTGVTYSNNITSDPQMNKTGVKPDPYYMPTNGGNLNNTGTDVGLPFLGAAPDMGAFEID